MTNVCLCFFLGLRPPNGLIWHGSIVNVLWFVTLGSSQKWPRTLWKQHNMCFETKYIYIYIIYIYYGHQIRNYIFCLEVDIELNKHNIWTWAYLGPWPYRDPGTWDLGTWAQGPGPGDLGPGPRLTTYRRCTYIYIYIYIVNKLKPFPSGVVALRGIHFQRFYSFESTMISPFCLV